MVILQNLVLLQGGACRVFSRRIANHSRKVHDQEHDVVDHILKVAQFVDQPRVAHVQVRCGRIEPGLDAQRPPGFQLIDQL